MLGLFIQVLYLVADSIVNALVEYSEHVVLLPHIVLNLLELFFVFEQLPVLQFSCFLYLLFLHEIFQLSQHLKELSDQQIPDDIRQFGFLPDFHSFLGY